MAKKKTYTLSPELEAKVYAPRYPFWTALTFFVTLAAGCVLAFLLFLRPSYSEEEKRELAPFPSFSMAALLDGSYFDGIDRWFSDTFPLREQMVSANARVQSLYGIHTAALYPDENPLFDDDEIPDAPSAAVAAQATTAVPSVTASATTTTAAPTQTQTEGKSETTAAPSADSTATGSTATATTAAPSAPPVVQQLGSVLVVGDTAYEYYSFSQSAATQYIGAVNRAADALAGQAQVYDLLIPLAMDITLDDSIRAGVNSADQKKAIDYIYGSLNSRVHTIDVYSPLRQHRDEYLYFRTDHHWTATGAYYAYAALCEAMERAVLPLADYETMRFEGYLGSLYTKVGKPAALENNPDTVIAYLPPGDTTLQFTDRNGAVTDWRVIQDVSGWNPTAYYSTFIGGDHPYTVIRSGAKSDGSSCVVVKESFGNAFVPFLTEQYETIHVIDYRYYTGELTDFVKQNGVQDVIFINNMSATRSTSLMEALDKLVAPAGAAD